MENGSDAYAELLELTASEGARRARDGALQLYLGTVVTAAPLEIDVNGTVQRAVDGNLWINPALTDGQQITGPCSMGGVSGRLTADGKVQTVTEGSLNGTLTAQLQPPSLVPGDTLVLLTRDQQSFFILCKEVRCI